MPANEFEIRTGVIDEILGKTPTSIVRWGVTVVLVVVMIALVGSWFFKYPDVIVSSVEITTLSPPANVLAKSNGKIDSIFVVNSQMVIENQLLATIQNPAGYRDVFMMAEKADALMISLQENSAVAGMQIHILGGMRLGELQSYFSVFLSAYQNLANYQQLAYYEKKAEALRKQVQDYRVYYNYAFDQRQTLEMDLKLAEGDFNRNQRLFENQVIAELELERSKSQYLNKRSAFESMRSSLANINIQISQLENNILELELQNRQQHESSLTGLNEAYNNLKAQLEIWEQRYVLRAPQSGTCVFTRIWSKNQNLLAGEVVMTILPQDTISIFGQLLLPVAGAGKVKTGQRVLIKLHNYPHIEYGQIEGIVRNISAIPHENHYYVEVGFPDEMKTSYGIDIPFSQNMQGIAEIITEDIRLLTRVLLPVKYMLSKQ
jgi:multidrug resistance efflux pump